MKTLRFTPLALLVVTGMSLSACQEKEVIEVKEHVSGEVLEQIQAHGYSTVDVKKIADGYIVEGDILLSPEDLASQPDASQVGSDEQYWSGYKVGKPGGNTVRTIRVKLKSGDFRNSRINYNNALQQAVDKYNGAKRELDLYIDFKKVGSNESADITFEQDDRKNPRDSRYYYITGGVSQFPSGGNPGRRIKIGVKYNDEVNNGYSRDAGIANLLAHEMGHAIGYRHTDIGKGDKASCSGQRNAGLEGNTVGEQFGENTTIGAKYIPQTPGKLSGDETNSWMLACMPFDRARGAFEKSDKKSLSYLYKRLK